MIKQHVSKPCFFWLGNRSRQEKLPKLQDWIAAFKYGPWYDGSISYMMKVGRRFE